MEKFCVLVVFCLVLSIVVSRSLSEFLFVCYRQSLSVAGLVAARRDTARNRYALMQ